MAETVKKSVPSEYLPKTAQKNSIFPESKSNFPERNLTVPSLTSGDLIANVMDSLQTSHPLSPDTKEATQLPANRLKAPPRITLPFGGVVQTKLTIGEANDRYEQEADQVAKDVVQRINSPGSTTDAEGQSSPHNKPSFSIQRHSTLQNRAEKSMSGASPAGFENRINRAKRGGTNLAPGLQQQMSNAMGSDFRAVKIHTGKESDSLNRSIQAKAFTTGRDIFFRQGAYNPSTRGGQELIAHELTHVVQQNGVTSPGNSQIRPKLEHQSPENLGTQIHQNTPHPVIQRYMGFEFQTVASGTKFVDGEGEKKKEESDKLIYKGKGWEMKSDSGDLECITDHQHVPETKKGKANLGIIMGDIEATMGKLKQEASSKSNNRLTKQHIKNKLATDSYPDMAQDSYLQVREPITAHPQATVGMELDKIPALMTMLTNHDANTDTQLLGWTNEGYYQHMKAPVQQAVSNIPTALQTQNISAKRKLQGVIALISSQVRTIKKFSETRQSTKYPKTAFSFMLRNPLSTIFDLLESEDKELLKTAVENEDAQLLRSFGVDNLGETKLWDIELTEIKETENSDFTIKEWLAGAIEGNELMGNDEWHGIGEVPSTELGGVEANPYKSRKGAIIEARHIADKSLPLAKWEDFAEQFFDAVVLISQDVDSSGWEIGDHRDLQELENIIDIDVIKKKLTGLSNFKNSKEAYSHNSMTMGLSIYEEAKESIQENKEYIQQLIVKVDNYDAEKQLLQDLLTEIDQTLVEVNQKIQELTPSDLEDDTTETNDDSSLQVLDDSVTETETETETEIDYLQYLDENSKVLDYISLQKANIDQRIMMLQWNQSMKEGIKEILQQECGIPEQYHEDIIDNWQQVKENLD